LAKKSFFAIHKIRTGRRTGKRGQAEQDRQNRTGRTGQLEKDSQKGTGRIRLI
jgi:membrane protein implicated in regulation of membrane protease activity